MPANFYEPLTDPTVSLSLTNSGRIEGAGFTLLSGSLFGPTQSIVLRPRQTPGVDGRRYRVDSTQPNVMKFQTVLIGSTSIPAGRLQVIHDMVAESVGRLGRLSINIAAIRAQNYQPWGVIVLAAQVVGAGGKMTHPSVTNSADDLSVVTNFTVEAI